MDYAVAVIVYLASILGVGVSIWGMVVFKNDRRMINFMVLCSIVFCATTYIGGMMVQTFN